MTTTPPPAPLALYRKYRSQDLADIRGQEHITSVLEQALAQGRIAHAYLLTGPRGVGKTSVARILARRINGLSPAQAAGHLDIIEIDAASNNGVDDIRELRDRVHVAPASARYKVYIIDEVHMLSRPAFNALLKTLEEPPAHVVFILATTDVDKVPTTVTSRTQRFGFRMISPAVAAAQLRQVADAEGIAIDDEALSLLAERGEGSLRDSLGLLDQVASLAVPGTSISRQLIETTLGLATHTQVQALLAAVDQRDADTVATQLTVILDSGVQPTLLARQLTEQVGRSLADHPDRVGLMRDLVQAGPGGEPRWQLVTTLMTAALAGGQAAAVPPGTNNTNDAARPTPASLIKLTPAQAASSPTKAPDQPPVQQAQKGTKTTPAAADNQARALDWSAVLAYTRAHHMGLHSVLTHCDHTYQAGQLTIYARNSFYKKKLDDGKYRQCLVAAIAEQIDGDVEITTLASSAPSNNSQVAAVAAMMGGGEEVALDEAIASS